MLAQTGVCSAHRISSDWIKDIVIKQANKGYIESGSINAIITMHMLYIHTWTVVVRVTPRVVMMILCLFGDVSLSFVLPHLAL